MSIDINLLRKKYGLNSGQNVSPTPSVAPIPTIDVNSLRKKYGLEKQSIQPSPEQSKQLIKQALQAEGIDDPNTEAYALATVEYETAGTMQPIEEIGGREQARKLGYSGGENYYGRGYIQLTHDYNYKQMGERIGVPDLAQNPEKALDPQVSAKILAAFFKDRGVADAASKGDFVGARGPINGTDQAEKIAGLTQKYLQQTPSSTPTAQPSPNPNPVPTPSLPEKPQPLNLVSPFSTARPIATQFGEPANPSKYPGGRHMATDITGKEGEKMVSPAGGTVAENPMTPEWPYGNRLVVIGANPQEHAQKSPEEIANPWNTNPDEDWYAMNHLQKSAMNPQTGLPYKVGDYIATGSGDLRMGHTGFSFPPDFTHLDMEAGRVGDRFDYPKNWDVVKMIMDEAKKRIGSR